MKDIFINHSDIIPTHANGLLLIDLEAIAHNWRLLNKKTGEAHCSAVVKANAYGLGMEPISQQLAKTGCRTFFVAFPEEGIALRNILQKANYPTLPIYILSGLWKGAEEIFQHYNLSPVLNSMEMIALWKNYSQKIPFPPNAAIQIDTGMNRLGLSLQEAESLLKEKNILKTFPVSLILSHLACADDPTHPLNKKQLQKFHKIIENTTPKNKQTPLFSLANSSGIFLGKEWHFNMARPGIALYGGSPQSRKPAHSFSLKSPVRLIARILQIHTTRHKETVGYGATWKSLGPRKLATVAAGYADGYLRALSNLSHISIAGQCVPVVGRVSMDAIIADITEIPDAKLAGAITAEILSPTTPHTIDNLAHSGQTISYEILTALGQRYHRFCYNETKEAAND